MQSKYPANKSCSGASGLTVMTSKWQNVWCERGRAKGPKRNGRKDRVHKCSHNPVKSAAREKQCLAKQIKHIGVLRNCTHILKLLQCTLCHPSHFSHFMARPSQKHMPHLLTVLINKSWFKGHWNVRKATLQIHKPGFMSLPVTMLLLDFCHQIQHCTGDYFHMRNVEIVGGKKATEQSFPIFICTLGVVSYSYFTQRKMV